jgi:hypothetical protein
LAQFFCILTAQLVLPSSLYVVFIFLSLIFVFLAVQNRSLWMWLARELVLMLQGAKRKTSRIEFGAHQVVIVRSEEAKKTLPEKFNIDPDWVMTIQVLSSMMFCYTISSQIRQLKTHGELFQAIPKKTLKLTMLTPRCRGLVWRNMTGKALS